MSCASPPGSTLVPSMFISGQPSSLGGQQGIQFSLQMGLYIYPQPGFTHVVSCSVTMWFLTGCRQNTCTTEIGLKERNALLTI